MQSPLILKRKFLTPCACILTQNDQNGFTTVGFGSADQVLAVSSPSLLLFRPKQYVRPWADQGRHFKPTVNDFTRYKITPHTIIETANMSLK